MNKRKKDPNFTKEYEEAGEKLTTALSLYHSREEVVRHDSFRKKERRIQSHLSLTTRKDSAIYGEISFWAVKQSAQLCSEMDTVKIHRQL